MTAPLVRRTGLDDSDARRLIRDLDGELTARYPDPGTRHFRLDAAEVAEGSGTFLVARFGGEPAGCGAVRRIGDGDFEIKRMYVAPAFRRRGVARAVLAALEEEARSLGARRVVLETGIRQVEALALHGGRGTPPSPRSASIAGRS